VALGAASALPLWSRAVFAADRPALPIPDLLTADARSRIQLVVQSGNTLLVRTTRQPGAITAIFSVRRFSCAKVKR
jgi:hypothetical protein